MSAVLLDSPVDPAALAQAVPSPLAHAAEWAEGGISLPRAWMVSLALTLICTIMLIKLPPEKTPEVPPPHHVMHAMLVEQPPPPLLPEPTPPQPQTPPPQAAQPKPKPTAKPERPVQQPAVQPALVASTAPAVVAPTVPAMPAPPSEPVIDAPPAPPAPVAKPRVTGRVAMGVVCPTQIKPAMPMAARQAGISGVVHARAVVRGGRITDVQIIDGPKVFHGVVKAAMSAYQCDVNADEAIAEQEFVFQLE